MNELHLPLLELAVFVPLVGALMAHRSEPDRARRVALAASGLALAASAGAWFDLAVLRAFEAHDAVTLLGWLPGGDPFAVDELSAPLLPLAALIYFLTILATLRTKSARFSLGMTLARESILLATLATKSPWVLLALLAAGVVPPAIELRRRGESQRAFLLHMGAFVTLLAAGVAVLEFGREESNAATIGSCLIAVAVLIRSGVFPLHCWLPDLFQRASFGTAILFTTPLVGPYVALRLVLPTAPAWVLTVVAVAALVTAVYAAGMALVERDARRFFAYLLLSQASLVLLGLEFASTLGLTGALCVWLSVGLAMTGFGLTLRCVESRVGRIDLDRYNGLHDAAPTLSGLFLLTGLASIGFPGTIGFIALELLVEGAVHSAPTMGALLLLTTALNGVAVMRAYFRVFTGSRHAGTIDLRVRPAENVAVVVLSLLILGGGVAPQPGVASREHAAEALLRQRARSTPTESGQTAGASPGRVAPDESSSIVTSTFHRVRFGPR